MLSEKHLARYLHSNTTYYMVDTRSEINVETVTVSVPAQVVFYIFLLLDIPSVLCALVLFYCYVRLPDLRQHQEANPLLIYLLVGSFLVTTIDVPFILLYLQNHYFIASMQSPHALCTFWIIYDYGLYSMNLWLMALTCLERYLRIFFNRIIVGHRSRRLFLYYISPILIVLFDAFWYLYLMVLYPCAQTQFDPTQILCGFPCYKTVGSVTIQNMDWTLADLLPLFLAVLFIVILILHVLYQRYKISKHLMQPNAWRRTRRMFLQLLPVVVIFLVFNMPLIIVGLLAISDPWYNTTPYFYVNSLSYCLALCMPFAVLSKQKTMRRQLSVWLRFRTFNQIRAAAVTGLPMRSVKTHTIHKSLAFVAENHVD